MTDFLVVGTNQRVDAWSNRRLPFEPRGSALEFRTTLREAVAELAPKGILRCVYDSAERTFCDTENVLLYNVGMSAFRPLVEAGLVFERSFDVPTPPTGQAFAHHHSYAMSDGDGPECWATPRVVSSWQATVPARPSSAAGWWLAVSRAVPTVEGGLEAQPFGLRLRVAAGAVSIQSALKAMLDGTIAALHSDPTPSSLAVERVAAHLGASALELVAMLARAGPLGARNALVRAYRDGVQWNPADDLCVACSVVVDARLQPGVVAGELVEVAPL